MRALKILLLALTLLIPVAAADPSDDDLYDKVRIQLANDREIGGGKIDVKVASGVIELSGKVRTDKQRSRAEKVAKKVKGVKQVVNKLVVAPA